MSMSPSRLEHNWNGGKGRTLRLTVSLDSRVESVDVAESMIVEFCGRAAYGERQCEEIGLAVREAVANAVIHGNRMDLTKKVAMTAELTETGLTVSVRDEGQGFDPDSVADPLLPDQLLNESGRGLFLVRTCVDDVILRRHESCGMEITLIKKVSMNSARRNPR